MAASTGLYAYHGGQWVLVGGSGGSGSDTSMPGPDNTGVPSGTMLTQYTVSGNVNIGVSNPAWVTGSGTASDPYTIDSVDLSMPSGSLNMYVGNVVVKNSKIHSSYFRPTGGAVIQTNHDGVPEAWDAVTIQDCEIYMDAPCFYMDGVFGQSYTLKRCNIYHTNDGIGTVISTDGRTHAYVKIDSCWVHDLSYFEGMYAPAAPDYSSLTNGTIVVNQYGYPVKPDGSHCDCWQLQGGSDCVVTGCFFDGRQDYTTDENGSTTWVRKGTNYALTDPAGNGTSPWGSYCANSAIQFNNNQAGLPTDNVTIDGNWFRGGRYATLNWAAANATGGYQNYSVTNNVFMTPSGWSSPPWSTTGQFGYNSDGTPKIGAMSKAAAAGYPIGVAGNVNLANIAYGGNTMAADGSPTPWHQAGNGVPRSG